MTLITDMMIAAYLLLINIIEQVRLISGCSDSSELFTSEHPRAEYSPGQ